MAASENSPLQFLFSTTLVSALLPVESLRRRIVANYIIIGFVAVAGFALEAVTWMSIGVAIVIIFVLAYTSRFGVSVTDFINAYKSTTGKIISQTVIPGASYDYDGYHKLRRLNEAFLINGFPELFGGMHLLTFTENDVQCSISEIQSSPDKKHRGDTQRLNSGFNGLVGFAAVNTPMAEPIIIISNSLLNNHLNAIGTHTFTCKESDGLFMYSTHAGEIEKIFPKEARHYLDNSLQSGARDVFISIYSTGVCVAVHSPAYLKPSVFKSVFNYRFAESYFKDLQFIYNMLRLCSKRNTEEVQVL